MADNIKAGSRVVAPLGFREVEGTVTRVSKVGQKVRVMVRLDVAEMDIEEPFIVTFERRELKSASAA